MTFTVVVVFEPLELYFKLFRGRPKCLQASQVNLEVRRRLVILYSGYLRGLTSATTGTTPFWGEGVTCLGGS